MAFGQFFTRYGSQKRPNKATDFSREEKERLAYVKSSIFSALNGEDPSREEVVNTTALTDVQDIGMLPQFTASTNILSKYIYSVDRDKRPRIETYREMSKYPEIAFAVDEFVDEAINEDKEGNFLSLSIKNKELETNDNTRKTLIAEFEYICNDVLKIQKFIDQWFREFMIDGEIFFEKIIDIQNEDNGIIKVKKLMTTRCNPIWKDLESDEILFFAYQDDENQLLNMPTEMIAYANSGLYEYSRDESMKIVNSFLEEAKTTYKRLKLLEDALVIYRIVRAPERRVFKIDVGNLPKGRAEQFMNEMITRYRQKKFFNTETGDISEALDSMAMTEDYWFPTFQGGRSSDVSSLPGGCLSLDTKIPLLDGRELELKQIIEEHKNGKQNWVYSCDPITGKIKPGRIDRAGITKINANLMKITFDNGESVKCTPEHKFVVVGKGKVEAKYLKENDSIMPNNKKVEKYRGGKDYEFIYDNNDKKWIPTHKMVSESIKNTEFYKEFEFELCEEKRVIHHKDVNRFNNTPENLVKMGFKDHFSYHSKVLSSIGLSNIKNHEGNYKELKKWRDNLTEKEFKKYCEKVSKGIKEYINSLDNNELEMFIEKCNNNLRDANRIFNEKMNNDLEFRDIILSKRGKSISITKSKTENRIKQSQLSMKLWEDETYRKSIFEKQSIKFPQELFKMVIDSVKNENDKTVSNIVKVLSSNDLFNVKFMEINTTSHSNFKGITNNNLIKIIKRYGYDNWKHFKNECQLFNHRITKIEYLTDTEDVGDLQIDNKHIIHDYHTYAISSGIFVSNSGLGEIEDVEYFRNKLYQGLKIPRSRYGEENRFSIGNTDDITREEQKFVKAVKRFTRRFSDCLLSIFITHLQLKGIADEFGITHQDLAIHLLSNNLFERFMEAKILELQFQNFGYFSDLIDTEKPMFSREWVAKKYLEIDEEAWQENINMLVQEENDSGGEDEDQEDEEDLGL